MITFSTIKEAILEKAQRILKVNQFGVKTADQVSSFGDDSSPINDTLAVYASTSENSDNIIIGYINKNQKSTPGEKRIFSLNQNGELSFSIHLRTDGTCEIGAADDNAVRYSKLESAFNQLKSDFNNLVMQYNLHQHTAANGATPPTTQGVATQADISQAKIESIKVPSASNP